MPTFSYSAADRSGKVVKGIREAENEKTLAQALKSEGLFLLDTKDGGKGLNLLNPSLSLEWLTSRLRPVSIVEKMFFARNISVMIGAGLSLTRSLEALEQESSHLKFKKILVDLNQEVVKGKSFAEALRVHKDVFGELFINMIEVGETTGKLTLVLRLLANQMKKDYDLHKRVRGAMLYPAIILTALLGVGVFMMLYIVPVLVDTIKQFDVDLPFTTKIIIAISDFLVAYWILAIGGGGGLVLLFWRILKTSKGKTIFDRIVLKTPIFGVIVKNFNNARFCRILAYLITSGVPIVRSLEITASVLGNSLFRRATEHSSAEIQKGKQLHAILAIYPELFPKIMVQMISVGEETGKISSMMIRLALFYEEDVSNTTKNLSTIIEPILMIIIGVVVGFFAVSMLQPIYSSVGSI